MALSRREFFADLGKGMLLAGLGSTLAAELGQNFTFADEKSKDLTFGGMEPLVRLLQDTPAPKLTPLLVDKLREGTQLKQLVAAAALANARTFGGEDYIGFHTMMALGPALEMSKELPDSHKPLPVLKVLYRNSNRIQAVGGHDKEVLHAVNPGTVNSGKWAGEQIRDCVHNQDKADAEQTFASVQDADVAFNALLHTVEDAAEVHRVVLVWRAWDMVNIVGREYAHTMLRQSIRYCVDNEKHRKGQGYAKAGEVVTKVLDQHKLDAKKRRDRTADDAWVAKTSENIYKASPEQAAGIVAEAIDEGFSIGSIAEAIRLTSNELVLRDKGRPQGQTSDGKPVGSCHGDSIGVHASDSANAWCNLAAAGNERNSHLCLLLAGYQVALDRAARGGDFLHWDRYPLPQARIKDDLTADKLLAATEEAIRVGDQMRATACVAAYGEKGGDARKMFQLLLKYAISEDGALHAEKFYRTVTEAFNQSRQAHRWLHLISLAKVTASEYGRPAPGQEEARKLLKV
ncbi:MAG TPA: hypothetical protein VGZ47_10415 [Gemmataceae bacterium]|nr:hypothetical protein [Gemmataceae bacterium]